MFDSLYCTLSPALKHQIAALLASKQQKISVHFMDVQMQAGGSDCGLFPMFLTASKKLVRRNSSRLFERQHASGNPSPYQQPVRKKLYPFVLCVLSMQTILSGPKLFIISACNGVCMAKTKSECVRFVYCSGCACPCALYSKTG